MYKKPKLINVNGKQRLHGMEIKCFNDVCLKHRSIRTVHCELVDKLVWIRTSVKLVRTNNYFE